MRPTPDDVAQYLRDHPEFFDEYAEVLAQIYVPHPHGGRAIPITERQIVTLRDKARAAIRDGRDPSADRKALRREAKLSADNTFEGVARQWLAVQKRRLTPATYDKAVRTLEANAFPWIGTRPIAEIDPPEALAVVKRIEARGANETAHRVKARMGSSSM